MRRALRRPFVPAFAAAVAITLSAALGLTGCGETSGNEVVFRFAVAAPAEAGGSPGVFTTSTGWRVTLHQAVVAVGPVYLHENPPHLAATGGASLVERFASRLTSLLIRPAFAHAGDEHFEGGAVLGEWLEQVAVDVSLPDVRVLGEITGDEATVRSFTVHLDPPRPSIVGAGDPTRGFPVFVEGEASRGETTVRFKGGLQLTPDRRRVTGLPAEVTLGAGGTVVLGIHPHTWFDSAHFDRLPEEEDAEGYRVIGPESQVHAAWTIGARSTRAFSLKWIPEGED